VALTGIANIRSLYFVEIRGEKSWKTAGFPIDCMPVDADLSIRQ